jgi:hypothetical protein
LALAYGLGFEGAVTVTWHVELDGPDLGQHRLGSGAVAGVAAVAGLRGVLVIAEMLRHLDLQAGLEHPLRQARQQPIRADQIQPFPSSLLDQLRSQLLIRTIVDAVIGHAGPSQPSSRSACQTDPVTPLNR